jgi:hypothetical protein
MCFGEAVAAVASAAQVGGMLLEELVLFLLRASGYVTIESARGDVTLRDGHAGLEVCGRCGNHQIDAIADFQLGQPFGHPQRLLVEAKMLRNHVGLPVLRNALGVLMDVSEFWTFHGARPEVSRYHYQYAVLSHRVSVSLHKRALSLRISSWFLSTVLPFSAR